MPIHTCRIFHSHLGTTAQGGAPQRATCRAFDSLLRTSVCFSCGPSRAGREEKALMETTTNFSATRGGMDADAMKFPAEIRGSCITLTIPARQRTRVFHGVYEQTPIRLCVILRAR